MRKKIKTPEGINNILCNVIRRIEKQGPGKKEKILNAWQGIAGEPASCHSRPVSIKRKILTVEVDSSTWLYALSLKKKGLLTGINRELGQHEIEDIRFRMGDIL